MDAFFFFIILHGVSADLEFSGRPSSSSCRTFESAEATRPDGTATIPRPIMRTKKVKILPSSASAHPGLFARTTVMLHDSGAGRFAKVVDSPSVGSGRRYRRFELATDRALAREEPLPNLFNSVGSFCSSQVYEHTRHALSRFATIRAARASFLLASRSPGMSVPVPKYISSGVCP
jgi:hypothetical protein